MTRVNGTLEALAARRASGILEIDGDPSGTVYFDQGQITCARASWVPDIGARLLGVLQPPAGAHWAAAFSCLDVTSVLAEASVRAERMARYGLSRTTPVRLHDFARSSAVLSRPQWVLACAIDGAASAQDLAWRCGLALYEAIENLGTLIAAGLCQPDAAEVASPRPLQVTRPSPLTEWFGPVPPQAALPRREHPGPVLSVPPVMAAEVSVADGMPASFEVTPAPQDLLRRVLDGLRRS